MNEHREVIEWVGACRCVTLLAEATHTVHMLPAAYLPTYLAALALHVPCVACRRTQSVLELLSVPHRQPAAPVLAPPVLSGYLPACQRLSIAQLVCPADADAPAPAGAPGCSQRTPRF